MLLNCFTDLFPCYCRFTIGYFIFQPPLTKLLSESGHVFDAVSVAKSIVSGSTHREFAISVGLDGWMVKQLQPGLAPINNALEVTTQIFTAGLFRLVALFFVHDFYAKVEKWTKTSADSALSKQGDVVETNVGK